MLTSLRPTQVSRKDNHQNQTKTQINVRFHAGILFLMWETTLVLIIDSQDSKIILKRGMRLVSGLENSILPISIER
jgi:hypothetical protein